MHLVHSFHTAYGDLVQWLLVTVGVVHMFWCNVHDSAGRAWHTWQLITWRTWQLITWCTWQLITCSLWRVLQPSIHWWMVCNHMNHISNFSGSLVSQTCQQLLDEDACCRQQCNTQLWLCYCLLPSTIKHTTVTLLLFAAINNQTNNCHSVTVCCHQQSNTQLSLLLFAAINNQTHNYHSVTVCCHQQSNKQLSLCYCLLPSTIKHTTITLSLFAAISNVTHNCHSFLP
jgi:hypothetical protein